MEKRQVNNLNERLLSTLRKKRSRYCLLMVLTFFLVILLLFSVGAFLYFSIRTDFVPETSWYQVSTSALEILYMYAFSSALFGILFIAQLKVRIRLCRGLIHSIKRGQREVIFKCPGSLLSFFYLKRITEEFIVHLGIKIGFLYKMDSVNEEKFKLKFLLQERFGFKSLKTLKRKRDLSLAATIILTILYLILSFSNPFLLFLSNFLATLIRLLLFLLIILFGVYFLGSFSLQRWVVSCLNWDEIRLNHNVEFEDDDFMPALSEKYGFFGSGFFFPLHFFYDSNLSFEMNFLRANKDYEKIFVKFK